MSQPTFLKVPFVWEKPDALIDVSSRLTFEPVKAVNHQLISTVTRVMAESVDASDRRRISERDPHKAAEMFLHAAREDFAYQDDWWQFGINKKGEIVGFVLPVIFPGCAKEGLEEGTIYYEEGTIYYMGILPEYRGLGLANDLLFKGTQILKEVGVWRVFCDTAVDNVRMIAAFKRVGYRQYGEPLERPI